MSNQRKSRSKTNQPIGTKFKYRNVWLEVVEVKNKTWCENCYFKDDTYRTCIPRACGGNRNVSKKRVYFKQIPA